MVGSINGTGTMWYGKAHPRDDGSVVVTEWITLLWLPLIPLGSWRVNAVESNVPWWRYKPLGDEYQVARVPLHIPHVLKGYAVTLSAAIIISFAVVLG